MLLPSSAVVVITVTICLGIFIGIGEVNPNEEGIVERKSSIWARWTLLVCAFLVSPIFMVTQIVVWLVSKENSQEGKSKWRYTLAAVTIVYAILFP